MHIDSEAYKQILIKPSLDIYIYKYIIYNSLFLRCFTLEKAILIKYINKIKNK